jgi:hypothetical protein
MEWLVLNMKDMMKKSKQKNRLELNEILGYNMILIIF